MPSGIKICPTCQKTTGPRAKTCSNCNHIFAIKDKSATVLDAAGRGRKTCSCGTICGVRTKTCPNPKCKKPFDFLPSSMKEHRKPIDWQELRHGDYIRVLGGSGPYHQTTNEDGTIENIYMSHPGIFKVHMVLPNGIRAWGVGKNCGHHFIYMGPYEFGLGGVICRAPHKIVKVKRKVR